MLDFVKTCVRWVTRDPQAMQHIRLRSMSTEELEHYYENDHKRAFEQRVAKGLDAAAAWREQRRETKKTKSDTTNSLYPELDSVPAQEYKEHSLSAAKVIANKGDEPADESPQRQQNDRMLMPPPPTPNRRAVQEAHASPTPFISPPSTYNASHSFLAHTMPSTTSRNLLAGLQDSEQEERARRYAEALRLPDDSGHWYVSESGLYFHLGLRGMEALLPAAWMVDFKTFPLILFEQDLEADCLIRNVSHQQFRAIRALRELVEAATRVRDLEQAGHKMLRIQRSLHKSLEDYLNWAITDGDLYPTSESIPTWVVMQREPKQPIYDLIANLAHKMDLLLSQHKCFYANPEPMPEESTDRASASPPKQAAEPPSYDDSTGRDPPVILGFLVVHSTISIFSMNAANNDAARIAGEEGLGIHMLGRFDFREAGTDVWNALAIAIACCHLRNSLLAGAEPCLNIDEVEDYKARIREAEERGERPAKIDRGRVAHYVSKKEFDALKKRKRALSDDGEYDRDGAATTVGIADGKGKRKAEQDVDQSNKNDRRKRRKLAHRKAIDSDPDR